MTDRISRPPQKAIGKLHSRNIIGGSPGIVENTQNMQLCINIPLIIIYVYNSQLERKYLYLIPDMDSKNKGIRPFISLQGPKNNIHTKDTDVSIIFLNISKLATSG